MSFGSHGPSEYQNTLTEKVWKESPQIKCLACYRFCRSFFRSWDKPTPVNSLEAKCKLRKSFSPKKVYRLPHPHYFSLPCNHTTSTFLLFSLFRHNISIGFPPPPPPPPHFYCFPSSTTTTTFLLFSLFHHHHHHISIFSFTTTTNTAFLLSFLLLLHHHISFVFSSTTTTTTTFLLFFLLLHHHHHHISFGFSLPPPPHFY